jgi:hypothetical protein
MNKFAHITNLKLFSKQSFGELTPLRLEIDQHEYLEYLIFYTHYNPEKHGITTNFKTYFFSSYNALSGLKQTKLNRKLVWEIFGGHEDFLDFHKGVHNEVKQIIIE